jgi:hypothetical protein
MGKKVRIPGARSTKPLTRLPRTRMKARDLLSLRRVQLFIELLEDRSTPSASGLGFDAIDLHWIAQQQLVSLQSDVYQIREVSTISLTNVSLTGVSLTATLSDPLAAAPTASPTTPPHEVIIVDSSVPNADELVRALEEGLPPGTWYDLYVIDSTSGGVEEIDAILSQYDHTLDAVHLITHGSAGTIYVGDEILDGSNAASIAGWGDALDEYGDLLIYGCDVAAGDDGQDFMLQLSQLTGADVAASTDATG